MIEPSTDVVHAINADLRHLSARDIAEIRPCGGFSVIIADPPWDFSSNSVERPGRNTRRHYPCMKTSEICAIPVKELCARDALLLMWGTVPMLEDALRVLKAWGFRYKSQLVWPKGRIGTGYWSRNAHEFVLIGRRGRFPCPRPALFPTSVIPGRAGKHSQKPAWVHERVEERHPEVTKLELFARTARPGWTALGNQIEKSNEGVA